MAGSQEERAFEDGAAAGGLSSVHPPAARHPLVSRSTADGRTLRLNTPRAEDCSGCRRSPERSEHGVRSGDAAVDGITRGFHVWAMSSWSAMMRREWQPVDTGMLVDLVDQKFRPASEGLRSESAVDTPSAV